MLKPKRKWHALDLLLSLALSAQIHQNDEGVRETARRLRHLVHKNHRASVARFIETKHPLDRVWAAVENLENDNPN